MRDKIWHLFVIVFFVGLSLYTVIAVLGATDGNWTITIGVGIGFFIAYFVGGMDSAPAQSHAHPSDKGE